MSWKEKAKVVLGKIIFVGAIGYFGGLIIRHPVLPPEPQIRPSIARIAEDGDLEGILKFYHGKSVEVRARPVWIYYNGEDRLEIGLQDGKGFLKACSGSYDPKLPLITQWRMRNEVSQKKAKEVYEKLKMGINSGSIDSITLRGIFTLDGVLEVYGIFINNQYHDLLRYSPSISH